MLHLLTTTFIGGSASDTSDILQVVSFIGGTMLKNEFGGIIAGIIALFFGYMFFKLLKVI